MKTGQITVGLPAADGVTPRPSAAAAVALRTPSLDQLKSCVSEDQAARLGAHTGSRWTKWLAAIAAMVNVADERMGTSTREMVH